MGRTLRVAIIGDFNPDFHTHHATNDSLQHAARRLDLNVASEWVPTPSFGEADPAEVLSGFDAVWISPGSPYRSFAGALRGIEFARTRNWPFVGT